MENEVELKKFGKPLRKAFGKLVERCEKSGIEYEWGPGLKGRHDLLISIQKGGGKSGIYVFGVDAAKALLDSDFEKYAFVEGYAEAIVRSIGPRASKTVVLGRLAGAKNYNDCRRIMWGKRGMDVRMELPESGKGVRMSIGSTSKALRAMVRFHVEAGANLSVRVEGLEVSSSQEIGEQLGRLVNSMFFELRKKRGIELFVRKEHGVEAFTWESNPWVGGKEEWNLEFPELEYDKEAIELYWHAVSAYRMPLLQYLGYYQVLEFYFSKYSALKDGASEVRVDKSTVERGACVSGKVRRGISEKDLLCRTVRGCISREELMSKLSNPLLKMYFDNAPNNVSKLYRTVSQFGVSGDDEGIDIREQLAERIYDIRCRIVHTKEGDRRGRILPFTEEEKLLQMFDLHMVAGLADNVLIAHGRRLSV